MGVHEVSCERKHPRLPCMVPCVTHDLDGDGPLGGVVTCISQGGCAIRFASDWINNEGPALVEREIGIDFSLGPARHRGRFLIRNVCQDSPSPYECEVGGQFLDLPDDDWSVLRRIFLEMLGRRTDVTTRSGPRPLLL